MLEHTDPTREGTEMATCPKGAPASSVAESGQNHSDWEMREDGH